MGCLQTRTQPACSAAASDNSAASRGLKNARSTAQAVFRPIAFRLWSTFLEGGRVTRRITLGEGWSTDEGFELAVDGVVEVFAFALPVDFEFEYALSF